MSSFISVLEKPASAWLADAEPGKVAVIAGPCSAESETQMVSTALALKQMGIRTLRVGIWKPRTRPNAFEGVGNLHQEWMGWLARVKEETGMRIATEVATSEHVDLALKAGIDLMWIGARTTVSPFAVQEIADALRGVDMPVMIKNPVNPDLALWIGAIERIKGAGVQDVAACHRGFSYYGKGRYRNAPQWDIPLELRRLNPDLPLICDPSHIAGARPLLREIAQRALDLGFDGLILESHIDPDKALSDAAQQLTPAALEQMLGSLAYRRPASDDELYQHELNRMRAMVDEMDRELLAAIARRLEVVQQIGELKRRHGVQFFQLARWREVFKTRLATGNELGLSDEFTAACLRLLHLESIARHDANTPAGE